MKKYWYAAFIGLVSFLAFPQAGDTQESTIDSLKRALQGALADSMRIKALLQYSNLLGQTDPVNSKTLNNEALSLSRKTGDHSQEAKSLSNIGENYSSLGKYDSARAFFKTALVIAREHHLERLTGSILNNTGNSFFFENKPAKAIAQYLEAVNYYKADSLKLASLYINISSVFLEMQQLEKALEYSQRSITYALTSSNNAIISGAYTNTGSILRSKKDTIASRVNYRLALQYARHITDLRIRMAAYHNMAITFNELKQPELAKKYADTSLLLATQLNNHYQISYSMNMKGMIEFEQKHYTVAKQLFYTALNEAFLSKQYKAIRESYSNLARIEKETGNLSVAFGYLQKYADLKDSILNEDNAKLTTGLEAKYQFVASQQQISQLEREKKLQQVALTQKNTINYLLIAALFILLILLVLGYFIYKQKQLLQQKMILQMETDRQLTATNLILQGQEEERHRLARDLHDGLGGMLSGVKYAFQKTKSELAIHGASAESFDRPVEMLDSSIHELRRITHNMGPESLIKYGISAAINDYCTNINKSEAVRIVFQPLRTVPVKLDQYRSNIVFRIVQELINNILRHAEANTAIVQLSHENDLLSITVEDDGKGVEIQKLSQSKGMGWSNIRSRIDYLKGTLDIKSDRGKGTYVHFTVNI